MKISCREFRDGSYIGALFYRYHRITGKSNLMNLILVFDFISPSPLVEDHSNGTLLPTFKVDLPFTINLIYTIPQRSIQRLVSMVAMKSTPWFSCSSTLTHLLCEHIKSLLGATVSVWLYSEKKKDYFIITSDV